MSNSHMFIALILVAILTPFPGYVRAQTAPDSAALVSKLNEFLDGASRNDTMAHQRFWADDLIYTGSSGRRVHKADIMRDLRSSPPPKPSDPVTVFTAADVQVHQYDRMAIVAFRLVATTTDAGTVSVSNYFNTGTFLKREGDWKVVAWQATKLPRPEAAGRVQIASAESTFHEALRAGDAGTLGSITDTAFVWINRMGNRMSRKDFLAAVTSGQLAMSEFRVHDEEITVYGDAGIVRGTSTFRRSGTMDSGLSTESFTMMLVYTGGEWKVAGLHTSRPGE